MTVVLLAQCPEKLKPPTDLLVPAEILRGTAIAMGVDRRKVAEEASLAFITLRRAFENPLSATPKTLSVLGDFFTKKGATFLPSTSTEGPGMLVAMTSEITLARLLKGARGSIDLPQIELASLASVAPRTLSRIESGRSYNESAMTKIIQALGREGVVIVKAEDGSCAGFRLSLERIGRKDLRF